MSISESFSSVISHQKRRFAGCIPAAALVVALSSTLPGVSHAWRLGDVIPDFSAQSTGGEFKLHDLIDKEQKYVVLFSHPQDFTPVCTTELAAVHNLKPEFDRLGAIALGLSVDTLANHTEWEKDILAFAQSTDTKLNFPIISDEDLTIAKALDMLPAEASQAMVRTPADNKTARTVFIIGPDKTIRMMMTYPMTTGRNFGEVLRVLDAIAKTDTRKLATPVDWKPGDKIVVLPGMSQKDAEASFKDVKMVDLPSGKRYLRFATLPEDAEAALKGAEKTSADQSQAGKAGL